MTEQNSVESENRYHTYVSAEIPWYVRLIWVLFWIFVVIYTIRFFLPAIQAELLSPP